MATRLKYTALSLVCAIGFTAAAQVAVVKENTTVVNIKDARTATVECKRTMTLMNKKAESMASFATFCDKSDQLTKFSATVTDSQGKVIKKFKKGDLEYTELSTEFATDQYRQFLDYTPPSYPITITWEWQTDITDGVLSLPSFTPIDDDTDDQIVEHATYTLTAPADYELCWKKINFDGEISRTELAGGRIQYSISAADLHLRNYEPYTRPLRETLPLVMVKPVKFEYRGTKGGATSWKDFGLWQRELINKDFILPQQFISQLRAMTDTCSSARSKVAVLYDFLAHHTRYVSIQFGLGGLKPAPAEHVWRTGFGDCKGLSNFMRAMLSVVGVPANYAIISTVNRHLTSDFAALGMCNHAILCVPQKDDTLWLECTAPTLPLGYVHDNIAGHNAILITPEGGKWVTLPEYASTDNLQLTKVNIALDDDGSAIVGLNQSSALRQYEDKRRLVFMTEKDRKNELLKTVSVPQATVENYAFSEDKTPFATPKINIDATLASNRYASLSGTRMFVPCTPMHRGFKAFKTATERQNEIYIDYGYCDEEEITIAIPQGYEVEALPGEMNVKNSFGEFTLTTEVKDGVITLHYRYHRLNGLWPAGEIGKLTELQTAVEKAYTARLVLRRK